MHCPLGKCLLWLPGDDKDIANPLGCREQRTICNLFSWYNFLRSWAAVVLHPAGVHSIRLNDLNVCKLFLLFLCLFPFFFQHLNLLYMPLLSILIAYSLLCFLSEISLSIIFPLIDLLQFDYFHQLNNMCVREPLWKLHAQINSCCQSLVMHTIFLVLCLGCVLNIRFLFWHGSLLLFKVLFV